MRVKYFRLAAGSLLALVILIGWFPLWAAGETHSRAQQGGTTDTLTPTQDTGDIFGFRQEVLFPAVIRFIIGVNLGLDNIDSLTLMVSQESGFEQIIPLDIEKNLLESAGVVSQFIYLWNMPDHPGLIPFEKANIKWQVRSKQEGKVSTAETQFMFEDDAHGTWETAGTSPLVLYWLSPQLAGAGIRNEILVAYDLLSKRTKLTPSFRFAIYDPRPPICLQKRSDTTDQLLSVVISQEDQSQYPCSADIYRQVYTGSGIEFLQRPTLGYSELQDLLITRMVYDAYLALWKNTPVPAWFLEGLASLYRLHPGVVALEITRDAARTDSLLNLSVLSSPLLESADFQTRTLWESESYLLALYLADRYGADAPFALALDITQKSGGFSGAFQALTGSDQNSLWDAWNRWLFTTAAEQAVTWTPYVSTTPTPTATWTSSPIPPTLTPSNTPTITVTPTSTFRGDQPPTVIVQHLTPTEVLTVTHTPLPPGSLPTAMPRPTTETGESGKGNNTATIGGIIVLAAVIVILVISLVSVGLRRRK